MGRRGSFVDWYSVLGVDPDATDSDITGAYRRRCFEWHPDRRPGDAEEAHRRFVELSEAYAVLSDPESRGRHDADRRRRLGGAADGGSRRRPYGPPGFDRVVREAEDAHTRRAARARDGRLERRLRIIVRELAASRGVRITRMTILLNLLAFLVCVTVARLLGLMVLSSGRSDDLTVWLVTLPLPAISLVFLVRALAEAYRARAVLQTCRADAERIVQRR